MYSLRHGLHIYHGKIEKKTKTKISMSEGKSKFEN